MDVEPQSQDKRLELLCVVLMSVLMIAHYLAYLIDCTKLDNGSIKSSTESDQDEIKVKVLRVKWCSEQVYIAQSEAGCLRIS